MPNRPKKIWLYHTYLILYFIIEDQLAVTSNLQCQKIKVFDLNFYICLILIFNDKMIDIIQHTTLYLGEIGPKIKFTYYAMSIQILCAQEPCGFHSKHLDI